MAKALFLLIGLALLAGCGGSVADSDPHDLRDQAYLSTEVRDAGDTIELVKDTRIRVGFRDEAITWTAGCNQFGADLRIDGDQLDLGQAAGTAVGCRPELRRQDEWIEDFFASNPSWQLEDDQLTLESDEMVIEFEAVTENVTGREAVNV